MLLRFRADRRGIAAVEFALVVPTLIVIVMAMMEFGCIFYTFMTAELATGDVNRQLASNHISSSQVSQMVVSRLPQWAKSAAQSSPSASGTAPQVWTITTTIPMKSATPTTFLSAIYGSGTITVKSVMQKEPSS